MCLPGLFLMWEWGWLSRCWLDQTMGWLGIGASSAQGWLPSALVVVLLGLMSLRALRMNRTGTPTVYPAGAWNPGRGGWQGPWVLRRRRLATDLQAIIAQALVTFL